MSVLLLAGCGAPGTEEEQAKKADPPSVKEAPKTGDNSKPGKKDGTGTEKQPDEAKKAAAEDKAKKPEKEMDNGEQREVAAEEPAPIAASIADPASAAASAAPEESEPTEDASASAAPEETAASASAAAAEEQAAMEEQAAVEEEQGASASASAGAAAAEEGEEADSSSAAPEAEVAAAAPADTTMYLTVPKMGISGVPVVEGADEASLTAGAGHVPGTGYPWVSGSNTYIAGHRIGYPGTPSDMVFWDLPSLVAGDEVILTDANGTAYTYAVSEILEVAPTELSVTAPVGRDVVSLQTCTEDFGDYWTAGPDWAARYVVRADRVS